LAKVAGAWTCGGAGDLAPPGVAALRGSSPVFFLVSLKLEPLKRFTKPNQFECAKRERETCVDYGSKPTWPPCIPFRENHVRFFTRQSFSASQGLEPLLPTPNRINLNLRKRIQFEFAQTDSKRAMDIYE
jgi:hypothetical protein